MSLSIAASGKGGVGKTTFCALLVRYMIEAGKGPILAVDADPNSNLGALLGMEPEGKIADLREDANQPANTPSGVPKARMIETWLNQIVQEAKGFDLLTMGRPEGPRCYCYVNDLLRQFLSRLKKSYPLVIIDNEAGMEHLSRLTTDNIDRLLIVSEPTVPSVRTVGRILQLADSLPIKVGRQAMLLNKTKNGSIPQSVRQQAEKLELSATLELSYSQTLEQLYERGGSVFDLPGELQDDPELTKIAQWCLSG